MKNLNLFNKLVYLLNLLIAFLLLVGYALPYIPPKVFPALSVLTLIIPVLIVANILFALYWLLLFKKQVLLSGIILLSGLFCNVTLYNISEKDYSPEENDFTIFSYNTKRFILDTSENETEGIWSTLQRQNPSIICLQEYPTDKKSPLKYPHVYLQDPVKGKGNGLAIYSKFPIINKGSLDFPDSFNNGIYVDLVIKKDTVRVYNLHMQSLSLTPEIAEIQQENKKKLISGLGEKFVQQQEQVEIFLENEKHCEYPVFVTGDFNNTVFSYTYQKIKGEKFDAFAQAGKGFGRTFTFDVIPLRIDFILGDDQVYKTQRFERFKVNYSDHYPIMATIRRVSKN